MSMATPTLQTIKQIKRYLDEEKMVPEKPKEMNGLKSLILDVIKPKLAQKVKKCYYKFIKVIKKTGWDTEYESELKPLLQKKTCLKALRKVQFRSLKFRKEKMSNLTERLKSANLTSLQFDSIDCSKATILDDKCMRIKYFRQLTRLTLGYRQYDKARLLSLSKNLSQLTSIRELVLFSYLGFDSKALDQDLYIVCQGIRRLNCLSTLYLYLDRWELTDEGVKELSNVIRMLPSLSNLTLNFPSNGVITGIGVEHLFEGLEFVQTVDLDLGQTANIHTFTSSGLMQAFSKLSLLKTLNLNFYDSGLQDQAVQRIFQAIQYLPSLSELSLNFQRCKNIENFVIEESASSKAGGLQHISKFVIQLKSSHVQFNGMASIFKWVQNLKSLTTFEIRITPSDNLDDNQVEFQVQELQLDSLTSFKLEFVDSSIKDNQILQNLFYGLKGLKNLQILNIFISGTGQSTVVQDLVDLLTRCTQLSELRLAFQDLDSEGSQTIFRAVQNLRLLSTLDILLATHTVTVESLRKHGRNLNQTNKPHIKALCNSFLGLTSLSSLYLTLTCMELSDDFFRIFSDSLKSLNSPQNFNLYLNLKQNKSIKEKKGITNNGFLFLMQGLHCIPNLLKLHIKFESNANIDNACLRDFAETVKKFKVLSKLDLDFNGCTSIDESEIPSFVECILQVKTLTYLRLSFSDCQFNKNALEVLSSKVKMVSPESYISF